MNTRVFAAIIAFWSLTTLPAAAQTPSLPQWAFPVPPGATGALPAPGPVDNTPHSVKGSTRTYTTSEIQSLFSVPDWFPDSHPMMPPVVSKGRKPEVGACAHCHQPNGLGKPEDASLAGLPEVYIIAQMNDFKSGRRKGSDARRVSVNAMIQTAKATTDAEIEAGAQYFAELKLARWIRVIETGTVPKTSITPVGMLVPSKGGGDESIGDRIIEVPKDTSQTELRNSTGFIAYVPPGSVAAGKQFVATGGGKVAPCSACHGPELRGTQTVPSIAGRSPSQMARQIVDFQTGARNGMNAAAMKVAVRGLSNREIVEITAYLATLEP